VSLVRLPMIWCPCFTRLLNLSVCDLCNCVLMSLYTYFYLCQHLRFHGLVFFVFVYPSPDVCLGTPLSSFPNNLVCCHRACVFKYAWVLFMQKWSTENKHAAVEHSKKKLLENTEFLFTGEEDIQYIYLVPTAGAYWLPCHHRYPCNTIYHTTPHHTIPHYIVPSHKCTIIRIAMPCHTY
jgi:hypothetical protein